MSYLEQVKYTLLEIQSYSLIFEDTDFIKDLSTVTITTFLAIYSCLLIADGYHFLTFLAIGFVIGAFYFNNKDGTLKIESYERNLSYKEQILEQFSNSTNPPKEVQLYYPPLTIVVNQLLDYIMRDFVSSWWSKLNDYNDPTFERLARERLNIVALNVQKILLNQERNDIVMSTVYGVANTLIIHMRECRALEESELSMKDFVNSNPQSPFAQLLSREEQHNQLCGLSQVFLKRTLPAADRDSLLLSSLLKEILANFVLENIVSSISNPDFLNRQIVDLLSNKDTKNSIQSTVSSIVLSNSTAEITSDEDLLGYSVVQKPIINDDLNATSKSDGFDMQQVTPPSSPEANNPLKPTPINTSPPKTETTMLASLQSPPPPPSLHGPPTMVFPRGSVNFTIMNISSLQQNDQTPDKKELVYIIQIERPAMEDQAGSEGGGYVITRTYADFESFHTILFAKHPKRITRIQLKLPLEAAAKSWLKKPSTQQKRKVSLEAVGQGLQKYLDTVVQDDELGTEQLILPFLRKETRSEIAEDGAVMSFSEEFQNEVASSIALIEASTVAQPSRSRSLFSRSNSTAALNVPSTTNKTDHASPEERQSMDQDAPGKWFAPRTKPRQGSFSSTHSNLSKDSAVTVTKEDHDEPNERLSNSTSSLGSQQEAEETTKPTNKALSSMDVELLIETTYALVVEIFNLTTSNNKAWMRRSILNLLREIVRRSYTEFISEQYSDFVNQYMSPNAIVSRLNQLGEQLWPEGKWMLDQKEQTKRTQEDKEKSKYQARTLMMRELIPNAVRQLIGEQNCNTAMDRMWARIQDPDLNRVLILQVLERIIKPILG